MPVLSIWKDQHINRLRKDMDRIFDRMWGDFGIHMKPRDIRDTPLVDVSETVENLILIAEIPGADPDDFEIMADDDTLTIKGEIRQNLVTDSNHFHRTERRYGSFSRTLKLPCRIHINDVKATYRKGILKIVMPKCRRETARRVKVEIK